MDVKATDGLGFKGQVSDVILALGRGTFKSTADRPS